MQRLDQEGLDQGRPLDCSIAGQAGHAALQSTAGRRLLEEECSLVPDPDNPRDSWLRDDIRIAETRVITMPFIVSSQDECH